MGFWKIKLIKLLIMFGMIDFHISSSENFKIITYSFKNILIKSKLLYWNKI